MAFHTIVIEIDDPMNRKTPTEWRAFLIAKVRAEGPGARGAYLGRKMVPGVQSTDWIAYRLDHPEDFE